MMKSTTPLRYPGGKQKISDYLKTLIKLNNLSDGIYVEPYAGGAGLALELLFSETIFHLRLNDADSNVYYFWKSVLYDTDRLITKILETSIDVNTWRVRKEILFSVDSNISELDKGFALFYLNRTNRSGIIKAGPIGGYGQLSKWKIDARFNKDALIKRIKRISYYKERIQIFNLDALDFLETIKPELLNNKSLVYLDPPYYNKGQELYLNAYDHEDHVFVADYMKNKFYEYNWLISYDDCNEIKTIYSGFKFSKQILRYSAANHNIGNELVYYSPSLITPKDVNCYNTNS